MMEAGVLVGTNGQPIHWHLPPGRTGGSLPDSRELWDVFWENRHRICPPGGFAHSHPGSGIPGPSMTDLTTFAAIDAALGMRLLWFITSSTHLVFLQWQGPERLDYRGAVLPDEPAWTNKLRQLSEPT